ncbi:hypothetical protein EIP91_002432 [Steccherinum ochraceum]|uniref:Uncharacterized protein n=1 Tax=Steccherinum ochraceum TaxID=92696 RepID=A0A4V2MWB3_9APHY|nr:hypothetical protein EIP91_002432 [Steccherinum ochraceum]
MHRFRKKSDVKRSPLPVDDFQQSFVYPQPTQPDSPLLPQENLPALPPASDFRTSLILPDLTRRFSVLRNSSGEPIGLDDLKSKFAEQRARGLEHQVSEEEEDMILEALGRIHARTRSRGGEGRNSGNGESLFTVSDSQDGNTRASTAPSLGQSIRSTETTQSSGLHGSISNASLTSSGKSSQYSRRMSNNLFGSGKFRDYTYMRSQHRRGTDSTRTSTVTHSESNGSMNTLTSAKAPNGTSLYSDNLSMRPSTPEGSGYSPSTSAASSPNRRVDAPEDDSSIGSRLSKSMSPEHLRHASLALDAVIKELEEEGDDEIVMERSPINRVPSSKLTSDAEASSDSPQLSPSEYDAGTAVSSDVPIVDGHHSASFSRTTSPTPRLPGYIPGMPRPMTPHDASMESDDQTPSATPRATSPRLPSILPQSPTFTQSFATSLHRSHSSASTARQVTPRPTSPSSAVPPSTSPLFLSRSTNGRFTPEDLTRSGSTSPGLDTHDSPATNRRRPTSPLSTQAFQPLAAGVSPSSRPSTPSNVMWNVPSSPVKPQSQQATNRQSGHSRNGSAASVGDTVDSHYHTDDLDRSKSLTRSLRSPALPDSPWIDNGVHEVMAAADARAPSAMSNFDLNSSRAPSRSVRSPTPTHSPTSPTFPESGSNTAVNTNGVSSKHSSRNHHTFSFGSTHALLLSPIGNSSRSSLESAGSSYHSWDEDHKKDRLFTLFSRLDPGQTDWHDITVDKSSPSTSGTSTSPYESTTESEVIVKRDIGLSKSDFSAIQDKLVTAALVKAATPENRHRAPSIRRRRPSTSQSNYSYNGVDSKAASPAQHAQAEHAASSSRPVNSDHIAKASALLDSVVDSIQSPRPEVSSAADIRTLQITTQVTPSAPTDPSPTARHRALADALFGVQDEDPAPTVPRSEATSPRSPPAPERKLAVEMTRQRSQSRSESPVSRPLGTPKPSPSMPNVASSAQSPSALSSTHGHGQMIDPNELALDVQRRAEAATLALRKTPSNHKMVEAYGSTRRRISPNQISSPKLMSASTSVDTIPLRQAASPTLSPSAQQPTSSKLGSRFRKLTGTLRSKPQVPSGEEITPFPMDLKTPPSTQTLTYSPSQLATRGEQVAVSAVEPRRFENQQGPVIASPPASAGPGLKGFMSRFRKSRPAEPINAMDRRPQPSSATTSISSPGSSSPPASYVHSAPATRSTFSRSSRPITPQQHSFSPEPPIPEDTVAAVETVQQGDALKQLFDAASNLGLDQAALTDLIARSPSTSSRTTPWTNVKSNSLSAEGRKSRRNSPRIPVPTDIRPSMETITTRPSTEIRQLNIRKNTADTSARPRQDTRDPAASMVIRRTIILPSDPRMSHVDFSTLTRKPSASRKRRSAGAGSIQSKGSVQDRVPTPPPNRATLKRFSNDSSPPMPHLSQSFASQFDTSGQMEKSSSAYDSLYDMYGDVRAADPQGAGGTQDYQADGPGDGIPAVEVVELANGETIWSIVNGLRDDDVESYFGGDRTSFASEYSREEGVKVSFKEHGRKSSKGSNNSLLGRKKPQGANRPETKVFYSSSAQIGRLIENISRGMDSGPPQGHVTHSATSSVGSDTDARWTVEERLEHMLGKISMEADR